MAGLRLHPCLTDELGPRALVSLLQIGAGALQLGQGGVLAFVGFDDGVGDDGERQDGQQDVEFVLQTQEGAVGEGDDEAQGFPHAVVGERRFFVPGEEDPVKGCGTDVVQLLASPSSGLQSGVAVGDLETSF